MNGALGRRRYGLRSTLLTVKADAVEPLGQPMRARLVEQEEVLVLEPPVAAEVAALREPPAVQRDQRARRTIVPGRTSPSMSQYQAARTKAMRSRSRSTTRRVATDWTRPAESRS